MQRQKVQKTQREKTQPCQGADGAERTLPNLWLRASDAAGASDDQAESSMAKARYRFKVVSLAMFSGRLAHHRTAFPPLRKRVACPDSVVRTSAEQRYAICLHPLKQRQITEASCATSLHV